MNKRPVLLALSIVLLWIARPAVAEFYEYRDGNGNLVVTDSPPAGAPALKKEFRGGGINWAGGSAAESVPGTLGAPAKQSEEPPDFSSVTVELYMTDWCGYCKKAREYIRSLGAKLVEYNVDRDPERKDEMRKKSGGSTAVPFIDIGGTVIRGYSPAAIRAAIERVAAR